MAERRNAIPCVEIEGMLALDDADAESWDRVIRRERKRAAGSWEYFARRDPGYGGSGPYPWLVTVNDTTYAVSGNSLPTDPGLHSVAVAIRAA